MPGRPTAEKSLRLHFEASMFLCRSQALGELAKRGGEIDKKVVGLTRRQIRSSMR